MQTSDFIIVIPGDSGLNDKHPPQGRPADAHVTAHVCTHTHKHPPHSHRLHSQSDLLHTLPSSHTVTNSLVQSSILSQKH